MNSLFIKDYERFTPHKFKIFPFLVRYIRNHELRYVFWGRKLAESKNRVWKTICNIIIRKYRRKYGLEMNFAKIGGGYSPYASMVYYCE